MPPKSSPYHHGSLRAELLDLAQKRIEETGSAGLSLRELAREIGVSHGAPQRHFADKQALLDALAVRGLDELGELIEARLAACEHGGFDERLLAFAHAYVDFATAHPVLLGLLFARKDTASSPELRAANEQAFAAPQRMIEDAVRAGEIADDLERVSMAVLATIQGLATIIGNGMIGGRPPETVVAGTIGTLIAGLRAGPV
ncbi:TetR/AcrR family transcriptional regulator [Kutzneria sp. NPDC052558]|uniref:TetR/AcrR family transcriptional regulator n=1 Tax=Kutzneria sp. NPDC052558 TaxID=3364121 RepID=UPI0037C70A5A